MSQTILLIFCNLICFTFFYILEIKGVELYTSIDTATCDEFMIELFDFDTHEDVQVRYILCYYQSVINYIKYIDIAITSHGG